MATKKATKPMGRPTKYTPELATLICSKVASHACGVNKLTLMYSELPSERTIYEWLSKYEEFSQEYAQAKRQQADLLAAQIIDIADDSSQDVVIDEDGNETFNSEFAARSRIRIDARKWLASKLLPKAYGDKVQDDKTASDSLIEKVLNGDVIISKNEPK